MFRDLDMEKKTKLILVEYDIGTDSFKKFKNLYLKASIIYGLKSTKHNKSKFKCLYNKKFYTEAADDYANYINEELKEFYKRTNIKEISILNYFGLASGRLLFIFFLIRKIKDTHPGFKIIMLTLNKVFKILKENYDFLKLNDVEIIYESKIRLNLKSMKSILIPRDKISFIFISILDGFTFLFKLVIFKLVIFKLKNKTDPSPKADILYLSGGFGYWIEHKNGQIFDFYYVNSFYKIALESSLKVWCLTPEMAFDKNMVKYCMFKYISIYTLFKIFYNSINDFFELLPYLKTVWMLIEEGFLNKIFFMKSLEIILNTFSPRAVIYYDEVYCPGRMRSLILNKLSIDSYGFEHALDTYSHITYKSLRLYKEMPELFPKYFFVYGTYSKNLFSSYGYPENRMIEIGFDRIKPNKVYKEIQRERGKLKVLFIGQDSWFNELFEELYQKRDKFPIDKLFFRPHPGFLLSFNEKNFLNQYPDAILINSKTSNLNENIRDVNCVIGCYSTSLLNAIHQRKITVSWQPYGLEDLLDLKYWGAQIVESLEDVDWNKKANPDNVIREIKPKVDLVKFLMAKYGKEIKR